MLSASLVESSLSLLTCAQTISPAVTCQLLPGAAEIPADFQREGKKSAIFPFEVSILFYFKFSIQFDEL